MLAVKVVCIIRKYIGLAEKTLEVYLLMRTRAEKRHNDWKKAIRKKKIINAYGWDYYDNLHQYSKNKIHCSCPLCARKTRGKTVKKTGGPGENWSIKDEKRIEEMQDQIFDNE